MSPPKSPLPPPDKKQPPVPTPLVPPAPGRATLLSPVATDEKLLEQFKRYQKLKEKLLENTDFVWMVGWAMGDGKDERKFFKHRAQADKYYKALKGKGFEVELEKKIKKSGCMKLGKAFGISDWPVEEKIDPATGDAYYKVRAEAPNGQFKERTGACARADKGKQNAPFDTIMATALTRAADRAIMALLGGETTAEEFDGGDTPESNPAPAAATPLAPPKTHSQAVEDINTKFKSTAAAKTETPRQQHNKLLWVAAGKLFGNEAESRVNNTCRKRYNVDSITKLNDAQFKELSEGVAGLARARGLIN